MLYLNINCFPFPFPRTKSIISQFFIFFQTHVQLHSCCMMTCAVNGGGHDTLPRDMHGRNGVSDRLLPGHQQPIQLPLPSLPPSKPPHRIFGMRGSDIDKYSRVIFPIMFLSFHMMYWMIYLSISGDVPDNLVWLDS